MRLLCIFLLGLVLGQAQETLQLQKNQLSPKASLSDITWLQGHWQGEAFGGIAEEIWSPPAGTSMMFVFRLINNKKISFYEVGHIIEKGGTLLMQLKHFDANLKGWEEKDETVDFKLVEFQEDAIYFEGLTIKKISEDRIIFYVLVEEEGSTEEMVFDYHKVN